MNFFLLPRILISMLSEDIGIFPYNKDMEVENKYYISKTLHKYLNKVKEEIEEYYGEWDNYKKYTNIYEFIHTYIPDTTTSICNLKPLSRSFFKMIEIVKSFNILDKLEANNNKLNINSNHDSIPTNSFHLKSFHLAEGPGGFIEALSYMRKNPNDTYYGMTLIDNYNKNIPGWKKSDRFLKNNKHVIIENGMDGTGNLMNYENLVYCFGKYKGQMDIVTADGGFDFSIDFNNQENMSLKLIFAEIAYAVALQKKGGTFILKVFDIFSKGTLDLLYILSGLYDKVFISKPHTSRIANSEKYIICEGFRDFNTQYFIQCFSDMLQKIAFHDDFRFLKINYPLIFVNKIQEINAILGQKQIENISNTLNLIKSSKSDSSLENCKKAHIKKCIRWCEKYELPYKNINDLQTNIFLKK